MKVFCLAFLLLALVTGGQAADGDLGSTCGTGDTCTDTNAYCDATDTNNKVCKCNYGWLEDNSKCVRGANQVCDRSQCFTGLLCTSGACRCDTTTIGYAAGTDGTTTCSCPTGQAVRSSDGKCTKVIGQTCSSSSECIDNAVCDSSTTTCKCDTSKFFAAGSNGDTTCSCATTAVSVSGACKIKLDSTTCSSASDCVSGTGVQCNSGTCECDTSLNLAANTAKTACECATNYASKSDGICGKIIGQTCSAASECIDHTTCTGSACACDATLNRAGSSGATTCGCANNYAEKSGGTCGKVIGQSCSAASECIDYTTCTGSVCTCDTSLNRAGTSGATTCGCDSNSFLEDSVCKVKAGQTCSATSDCVTTSGMICQGTSAKTCQCNSTANFDTATSGATTCSCTSDYILEDGVCVLKVGQPCNSTTASCLHGAVCDKATSQCKCDTANGYQDASGSVCGCVSTASAMTINGKTYCGNKIGGSCNLMSASDTCASGTTCQATTQGSNTVYLCTCTSGSPQFGGSCSGAEDVAVSMAMLIAGFLMSALF